jgi:hypothetical protein
LLSVREQVSFRSLTVYTPLFSPSFSSKLQPTSSDINQSQPPLVHGCVGPIGGATNWNAIAGWVKYHQERWGMTHADIFVRDDIFRAKRSFDAVGLELMSVALNFTHYSTATNTSGENGAWLAKECRSNAMAGHRDYLIEFETGRFLVSESFDSLQDVFESTNEPDSVVFPTFTNDYGICNSNTMTFASATFVQHLFPDFGGTPSLCPQSTLRCKKSDGVTRHFMIANNDDNNNKSAHLIRFTNGVSSYKNGVDLHEDMSTNACNTVKDCKNILDTGECTGMDEIAILQQQVTSINSILSNLDLVSGIKDLKQNALCYAHRYPDLFQGYCQGDDSKCRYAGLYDHYVMYGSKSHLVWQCDHVFTPARPVTHRILGV